MAKPRNDSGVSAKGPREIARMVLAGTTVLALALIPGHSVSAAAQRAAGAPQLVLDSIRHDFGEVFAGEDLSHVFQVRNIGNVPLELSETPQLGTRPSKVVFRQPLSEMKTRPLLKVGSAAPS
jgi:hypothetical protein